MSTALSKAGAVVARALNALVCWLAGHEGLGSKCHRCGRRYMKRPIA